MEQVVMKLDRFIEACVLRQDSKRASESQELRPSWGLIWWDLVQNEHLIHDREIRRFVHKGDDTRQ